MEPNLAEVFLEMETARDIWDTLAQTYARKENVAKVYELRRCIEAEVQDVFLHFSITSLCTMWKRLDHLKNHHPICSTEAASFKEYIESE